MGDAGGGGGGGATGAVGLTVFFFLGAAFLAGFFAALAGFFAAFLAVARNKGVANPSKVLSKSFIVTSD